MWAVILLESWGLIVTPSGLQYKIWMNTLHTSSNEFGPECPVRQG